MTEHRSGSEPFPGGSTGATGGDDSVPEFGLAPTDVPTVANGWTITAALLGVIALVAVVAGVAVLRSDRSGGDSANNSEPSERIADLDWDADGNSIEGDSTEGSEAALGLVDLVPGGPRDGLESLRLPVVADPAAGLVEGQTVRVSGSNFPPSEGLGVVMCSGVVDLGGGAAQCQLTPYTPTQSDADGNFTVDHAVSRLIVVGGELIDCAAPVPEGLDIPSTCVIAVGAINDYDQSGIFPVQFDSTVPAPEAPTVSVEPTEGLVDGDLITIALSGTSDDWLWMPAICAEMDPATGDEVAASEDEAAPYMQNIWCEALGEPHLGAEYVGNSSVELPVPRWLGVSYGADAVDCGAWAGRCRIEVHTYPLPTDPVPLTFDPAVPATPPTPAGIEVLE